MALSVVAESKNPGVASAAPGNALILNTLEKMDIPSKVSKDGQKLYASLGANSQIIIQPTSDTAGTLLHQVKDNTGVHDIAKAKYADLDEFRKLTLSASIKTKSGDFQELNASRAVSLNSAGPQDEEPMPEPMPGLEGEEPIPNTDTVLDEVVDDELASALSATLGEVQPVNAVLFNAPNRETGETACYIAFKDDEYGQYVVSMLQADSLTFASANDIADTLLGNNNNEDTQLSGPFDGGMGDVNLHPTDDEDIDFDHAFGGEF